jgi:acyl-coenzyme A synthetase/AMP-(fatty) acid ligase
MVPGRTLAALLDRAVEQHPDKVCLVAGTTRLTYAALDARANRIARALVARGVTRSERVVIYGDNSADVAAAIWGVARAEGAFVVVGALVRAEKLTYVLRDAGACVLVADAVLAPQWLAACAALGVRAPTVLVANGVAAHGAVRSVAIARDAGLVRVEALDEAEAAESAERPVLRGPRAIDLDLAMILYTSGSTGEPKGVMMSHRNVEFASWSVTTLLENTPDDVLLGVVPLAFNYGLYQWLMAVRLGARLVLERGFTFPMVTLARVAEEGVTGFAGVPTMFAMLAELRDVEAPALPSVRYVSSTAAQLLPRHIEAIGRFFSRAKVYSMFGLTECKRVSWLPPEDLAHKSDSVGVAIPGTELWIEGPDGTRLGAGEVGELVVRGSHVMMGYWQKPELSARFLRPGLMPGERVLYTGDLCRLDAEGYLTFVARSDEVIKSRGEKVAPREVEKAIERIEGVRECAVIGVDDAVLGVAVKAFVVLEEAWRGRYAERDVIARVGQWLEAYMVPRHVAFVDTLPKTEMGKIVKKSLR